VRRAFGLLAVLMCLSARAHQTSDAYLSIALTNGYGTGRWAIALTDLSHVLTLDSDNDGELTDEEFEKSKPRVQEYAFERLKFSSEGKTVEFRPGAVEIQQNDSAIYLMLNFSIQLPENAPDLRIDYTLFSDTDPQHRGLFRLDLPTRSETTVFGPAQPSQRFFLNSEASDHRFTTFLREGVWHIWTGFDHILFLLALLLPSVLRREGDGWQITSNLRSALLNIIKIVTAFTIAHSITLALATLGLVTLPSRLVESIIAASVLLAALNNIHAIFPERTWMIAFAFGLIHGFGFATALAELHLPSSILGIALFAFNLGVELGQLAIVLVFVPIAFALRRTHFYQHVTLRYASVLIAFVSTAWLFERLLDKKILPF
jgi:hypothetical protein